MEIGRHRGRIANEHIKIGSNSYEKVKTFKYLRSLLTNQNSIRGGHCCLMHCDLFEIYCAPLNVGIIRT